MADTPAGFSGRRTVPVSLRAHGGHRAFIAEREISFVDGVAGALEHEGRQYVFSHTLPETLSSGSAASDEIYIFAEADPDTAA